MGFVFYPPSKRNITLNQAKRFSKIDFGQTKKIAVIVDENDGTIDWTAGDTIDWEDMLPNEYKMYKAAVDFIQTYSFDNVYTK